MCRPPLGSTAAAMSRVAFVILIGTLSYVGVRPAAAQVAVGATSADFLSFEIGGRSAGMAGAHTGTASGVTAQFWNPAALASMRQSQVGAMHASWLEDLSYEWLGYARPVGKMGVGSFSASYFHAPTIQGVDEFDNPSGEFKVYDLALTAGLARELVHGFSVGVNAKLIRQNLATVAATGPAVDLGAQATVAGATIGAVVQNLGPSLSFDGSSYPLPRQVRFGVGRGFWNERVLLAADYNMPRDYFQDVRFGTEFRAHPNVALRLGYRHEFGTPEDPANGLSYGLGLRFHQLDLDYALTPSNDFDDVHRLSFGYSFGGRSDEKKPEPPKREAPPPPPAPTGPAIIASNDKAPKPSAPTGSAPASKPVTAAPPPASPKATPAEAPPAPVSVATAPAKAPKPSDFQYDVVLPGYWSKQSAEAELKALELLGFRVKDAQIEKSPKSGYQVRLARLRSKSNAEDMAASLSRMSFRAVVEASER